MWNNAQMEKIEYRNRTEELLRDVKDLAWPDLAAAIIKHALELEQELGELHERMDALTATSIHSCSPYCKRPVCVARRQRDEALRERDLWKDEAEKWRDLSGQDVVEMRLCETTRLFLRPNVKYLFTVDPGCEACRAANSMYENE